MRAVEPLIKALQSDEIWVQHGAAQAFGKIGDKKAVDLLLPLLKDGGASMPITEAEGFDQRRESSGPVLPGRLCPVTLRFFKNISSINDPSAAGQALQSSRTTGTQIGHCSYPLSAHFSRDG